MGVQVTDQAHQVSYKQHYRIGKRLIAREMGKPRECGDSYLASTAAAPELHGDLSVSVCLLFERYRNGYRVLTGYGVTLEKGKVNNGQASFLY